MSVAERQDCKRYFEGLGFIGRGATIDATA
jgi:hypothetical protein